MTDGAVETFKEQVEVDEENKNNIHWFGRTCPGTLQKL